MNRNSLRIAAPAAALALAFGLSACGAANESDDSGRPTPAARCPARSTAADPAPRRPPWPPGRRASRPRTPTSPSTTTRSGPAAAASSSSPAASAIAGSDAYLDDEELAEGQADAAAGDDRRGPGLRQPDRGHLQPRRRRRAEPLARDHRQHLRGQDHQVGRRGDHGRQPRREAAEQRDHAGAPFGRLRHHGELHRLPRRRVRAAAGPAVWSRRWPVKGGEAAEGTSGVVAAVTSGKGTIGYADASQAGDLGPRPDQGRRGVRRALTPEAAAAGARCVHSRSRAAATTTSPWTIDRKTAEAGRLPDRPASRTRSPARRTTTRPRPTSSRRGWPTSTSTDGQAAAAEDRRLRAALRRRSAPRSRPRSRRSRRPDPCATGSSETILGEPGARVGPSVPHP